MRRQRTRSTCSDPIDTQLSVCSWVVFHHLAHTSSRAQLHSKTVRSMALAQARAKTRHMTTRLRRGMEREKPPSESEKLLRENEGPLLRHVGMGVRHKRETRCPRARATRTGGCARQRRASGRPKGAGRFRTGPNRPLATARLEMTRLSTHSRIAMLWWASTSRSRGAQVKRWKVERARSSTARSGNGSSLQELQRVPGARLVALDLASDAGLLVADQRGIRLGDRRLVEQPRFTHVARERSALGRARP